MEDCDVWEVDVPDVVTDEGPFKHYLNVSAGSKDEEYYLELARALSGQVLVLDNAVKIDGFPLPSSRAVYFLRDNWQELADRVRVDRERLRPIADSSQVLWDV